MAKIMNSIFIILIISLITGAERSYSQQDDVNVVNTGTAPVNTYNVDNGAIQPVQITCEINM